MIDAGTQVEVALDERLDVRVVDPARCRTTRPKRDGPGDADAVGDLDLEAVGEPGGDDVLGDPAGGVGGRAVDLRRVLAREGAAAVAGHAAVRVDDDLAAGQAGVAHRPAGHEAAGRVDVHDRVLVGAARPGCVGRMTVSTMSERRRSVADVGVVLGRDDDRADALRDAVLVLDGHLGLAVGPQVRQLAATCGPRRGGGPSGAPARSAAASARASRGRRTRTSSPGRPRRARTAAPSRRGPRAPRRRPARCRGDCSLTETSVPQVR